VRSFSSRAVDPELMDREPIAPADLSACLRDLAAVNTLTLARRPTLAWLAAATKGWPRGASFTLLDVGCGYGDMLRAVAAWAQRRGFAARLIGIDRNPASAAAARAATEGGAIAYHTGELFAYRPAESVDFIVSALFAHHLSEAELVRFLRWMEATAARGWFVNDLRRSRISYQGFAVLARAARWHRFVRHDGPLSIARSFREADWERLLCGANLPRAQVVIRRRFPFRLCVGRRK
jgi:SAM-dependent methyltransferase